MSAVAHWDLSTVERAPRSRRHLSLVPALPQTGQAGATEGFRLTVRGRRLLVALIMAVLVVGGWGMARAFADAPSASDVVVRPGQTLSEIAHDAYPHLPVGEAVVRVQLANDLSSLQVHQGQRLVIPR